MAPGASDKWKVLQLFHESLPKSSTRVNHIERVVNLQGCRRFLDTVAKPMEECEVGFYVPRSSSQLTRLRESGFCADDFEMSESIRGVPIYSHAGAAHQRLQSTLGASLRHCGPLPGDEHRLCIILSSSQASCRNSGADVRRSRTLGASEGLPQHWMVDDPSALLLAYVVQYQLVPPEERAERSSSAALIASDADRRSVIGRRRNARQQREYAKVRDPLIKVALRGLDCVADGTMNTVLLPATSVEAESVISLYLLGGGGSRLQRPPGVDDREALGGVVVQRIENQPLFNAYMALAADGQYERSSGAPRYQEDVVWHGTRLKRVDGEGVSLASKLQSIAEQGFDPQRCMKGAAAEGGIWVATSPLASFGHGCDGLVAFVLCLAKTHFNEWVDATSARVLQRERVLPLYSLVHA